MSFVHLHTHTEYSMLDGAARVQDVIDRAVEFKMPAVGITDHGYMYGAVDFYKAATKAGIKPIIGCEVYFTTGSRLTRGTKPDLYHLLLLAKNNVGYRNLMALVSEAAVAGYYYRPQVDMETLERYSEGLIGTSACMSGVVSKSIEMGDLDGARRWAERYAATFAPGDFYLEIQDQGIVADNGVSQSQLCAEIAGLAGDLGIGLVGTNDIHYLDRSHAKTQDILLCIGTGKTLETENRMRFSCDEFYLKSPEEMQVALGAYPEALSNTLEIAAGCDVSMEFGKIILPKFDLPDNITPDQQLRQQCLDGLATRYSGGVTQEALDRLDYELGIISDKGLAAYFLIVADFTAWARSNGIGVGPGRGSAAGSLISYALRITSLDPIEQGLLFERFLNPERTEMPDIDMDFDDERRQEVIEYVRERYGADRVAQIITFGTMKARAAIRDAARVLGYPVGVGDRISKLLGKDPDATLAKAMQSNPDFKTDYEANEDTRRIVDAAAAIEGITRNEGVHAAGVVICRESLATYAPVKRDTKGGGTVTQYEGKIIGELGLLKMDFLGLRTLTVIAKALENVRINHGVEIDLDTIPMDDELTFDLYRRADTDGVFQVESSGMRNTLLDLQPTTYADIVAAVALYRPGPMDSIPEFTARKHGRSTIDYYDDRLKPILGETYGMLVYQEQAMRIAMLAAGFTGAQADKLRKGMGKKDMDIMQQCHEDFIEGSVARGYDRDVMTRLWADIEKFGAYAFNKSHAAAYAVVSYQTAYIKARYPYEYMAAVLTSYTGKTDEIVKYVAASNRAGLTVLPPDVNQSRGDFTPVPGEGIRFGLEGIRGVGAGVVEAIISARGEAPFTSLPDFCSRVDLTIINKKAIEALIKAGAFDSTGYTRMHLMRVMEQVLAAACKVQKDRASGQESLFGDEDGSDWTVSNVEPPDGVEWDRRMKLGFEKETLGIYVSDHPLREHADELQRSGATPISEAPELSAGGMYWFAGLITSVAKRPTKTGKMMAKVMIEDLSGSVETVVFSKALETAGPLLEVDAIVRMKVLVKVSDMGRDYLVEKVVPFLGRIIVDLDENRLTTSTANFLAGVCAQYQGKDALELHIRRESGVVTMVQVEGGVDRDSGALWADLREHFGIQRVYDA